MPYLEVQKEETSEETTKKEVETPNLEGLTISEAAKKAKELNLDITYKETEKDISEKLVTAQTPSAGIKIYEGTKIIVEY